MSDLNYRVRDGYPKADCALSWARYRELARVAWILFAGWIPYGLLVSLVLGHLVAELSSGWIFAAVVPYIAALVIVANMAGNLRCPRCGYRFFALGPFGLGHNSFARKCRNCGLKKWQCDDSVASN